MADRWNGVPTIWATRYLNQLTFATEEDRNHAQIWTGKYLENITADPRQQVAAMVVVCRYADLIAMRGRLRTQVPGTDQHTTLAAQTNKLEDSLIKALRMAGLKTTAALQGQTTETGDVFSPPRERRPSELEEGPESAA